MEIQYPQFIGNYGGTKVYRTTPLKIEWTGKADVDADGSPRAYSPNDHGLDLVANAGHEGNWYGVITDTGKPNGRPVIQGMRDPYPGYYVSPTALVADHKRLESDPHRYFDSEFVNYIVAPDGFPVHLLGCKCLVTYGDMTSMGIVADIGEPHRIGEISIAMAKELGIPSSPRSGGVSSGVHYTVYA